MLFSASKKKFALSFIIKYTKGVTVYTVLCTCCTTSALYSDGAGIRLLAERRLSNEPDAGTVSARSGCEQYTKGVTVYTVLCTCCTTSALYSDGVDYEFS